MVRDKISRKNCVIKNQDACVIEVHYGVVHYGKAS